MNWHRCGWPAHALLTAALLIFVTSTPVSAQQESQCTWDRCALRVQRNFFGARLVRGIDGEKVMGLGLFPRALPFLAERSDSAAVHYDAFRSRQSSGTVMALLAVAAFIAGGVAYEHGNEGTGTGIMLGSLTLGVVGGAVLASGQNHLSQAVWWYNRSFAEPEQPPN
jgi:hypothetical protein